MERALLVLSQKFEILLQVRSGYYEFKQGKNSVNAVSYTHLSLDSSRSLISIPYFFARYFRAAVHFIMEHEQMSYPEAVSYTHLDVYKRQIFHLSLIINT